MKRLVMILVLILAVSFSLNSFVFAENTNTQSNEKTAVQADSNKDAGKSNDVPDRYDDKYWHFGFYYNPNDPAVFINKKDGMGWTNNFAHPISFVVIIVVVGLILFIHFYRVSRKKKK